MARRTAILLAACGAGLACRGGGSGGESTVELKLRRGIADALGAGVEVTAVTCATPTACTATVDGVAIPIAVSDAGDELAWTVGDGGAAARVIDTKALAVAVFERLADLELTATVDCGPRLVVVAPGDTAACAITNVRRGASVVFVEARALAAIAADGSADIELVLGPEAVTARTTDVPIEPLDEQSRALDRADPQGGADEGTESASTDVTTGAGPPEAAPVDAER